VFFRDRVTICLDVDVFDFGLLLGNDADKSTRLAWFLSKFCRYSLYRFNLMDLVMNLLGFGVDICLEVGIFVDVFIGCDGLNVGDLIGVNVGCFDGNLVGKADIKVGIGVILVGMCDGFLYGDNVGESVGVRVVVEIVGDNVWVVVIDDILLVLFVGEVDGFNEAIDDGDILGICVVGNAVGFIPIRGDTDGSKVGVDVFGVLIVNVGEWDNNIEGVLVGECVGLNEGVLDG